MSKQDKATTDRHARTLRELVKKPDNKLCADCKRHDARWASWNIGIFICIRCSGIHRSMGTHISKVKSVDLDVWTPEQMQSIQKWGNRRANLYWEAHLKTGHVPPDHKVESFIRSKYESRRWALEGPRPDDPSVLEQGEQASEPAPAPVPIPEQTAAPRSQSPASASPVNATSSRTAHPLLSTAMMTANRRVQQPRVSQPAPPVQAPSPPRPAPAPAPVNDLFSLDFHAAPVAPATPQAQQPKKDAKNDILALFSAPSNAAPPVQNTNAIWGGSNAWASTQPAPPVAAPADPWGSFSSAPAANATSSAFSNGFGFGQMQVPVTQPSQNIWGSAAPAPAPSQPAFGDIWGTASSPFGTTNQAVNKPAAKKDDAFGDLWS